MDDDVRALAVAMLLWFGGAILVALGVFGALALFASAGVLRDALFVGGLMVGLAALGMGIRLATGGEDEC
jgi:arginine exporter protein ArgO